MLVCCLFFSCIETNDKLSSDNTEYACNWACLENFNFRQVRPKYIVSVDFYKRTSRAWRYFTSVSCCHCVFTFVYSKFVFACLLCIDVKMNLGFCILKENLYQMSQQFISLALMKTQFLNYAKSEIFRYFYF